MVRGTVRSTACSESIGWACCCGIGLTSARTRTCGIWMGTAIQERFTVVGRDLRAPPAHYAARRRPALAGCCDLDFQTLRRHPRRLLHRAPQTAEVPETAVAGSAVVFSVPVRRWVGPPTPTLRGQATRPTRVVRPSAVRPPFLTSLRGKGGSGRPPWPPFEGAVARRAPSCEGRGPSRPPIGTARAMLLPPHAAAVAADRPGPCSRSCRRFRAECGLARR